MGAQHIAAKQKFLGDLAEVVMDSIYQAGEGQ